MKDNYLSDKTKLTIVLTLKDRVPFTYRWMKYMNDLRCPYKILIADGGKDNAIQRHLSDNANYHQLDYEYIRYPYDATIGDFYIKFENAISRVKSEYMLLADNDDFYLLERIPEIINFLDMHKDYAGARGELIQFSLYNRAGLAGKLTTGFRYLAFAKKASSIENQSPYERVENLCSNMSTHYYYANWYSIFRSETFHEVWEFLITLPVKEVIVTEMLTHVLMVMSGKIKIMPFSFYIRQSNTSMSEAEFLIGNEFLERCLINNSLSEFRLGVDQFFATKTKEERDRLLRAIASWLEVFVSNTYMSRTGQKRGSFFSVRKKIKKWFLFNQQIAKNYHHLLCLFFPLRKSKPVRLKLIEPYICGQVYPLDKSEGKQNGN